MSAQGRRRIMGFIVPLQVNNQSPDNSGSTFSTARLFVPLSDPTNPQIYGAKRSGTITSVTFYSTAARTVRFVTGKPNAAGSSFTYTGVSASIAVSTGAGTYSVSIDCALGDVLGVWVTSDMTGRVGTNSFLDVYASASATTPTIGGSAAISVIQANSDLVLYGSG